MQLQPGNSPQPAVGLPRPARVLSARRAGRRYLLHLVGTCAVRRRATSVPSPVLFCPPPKSAWPLLTDERRSAPPKQFVHELAGPRTSRDVGPLEQIQGRLGLRGLLPASSMSEMH